MRSSWLRTDSAFEFAGLLVLAFSICSKPISAQSPSLPSVSPELARYLLVDKREPVYPPQAGGISGTVRLEAQISSEGAVEQLNAVCGSPLLVQSAIDAVKTWRYRPYLLNSQPVAFKTAIYVSFPPSESLTSDSCPTLSPESRIAFDERRSTDSRPLLTNNKIIEMTKAGLSDDVIIATIRSHPGEYKTEPDDLIALKAAHVSNSVILALSTKSDSSDTEHQLRPAGGSAPAPAAAGLPIEGVVQAEIGNGEMKQARFAKILLIPAAASPSILSRIESLRSTIENARTQAGGEAGRNIVEIQCLTAFVQLRLALISVGTSSATPILFDADSSGEFRIDHASFDHYRVVVIGKVGMNAALWVSPERSSAERGRIIMDQPVISCYDAKAIF